MLKFIATDLQVTTVQDIQDYASLIFWHIVYKRIIKPSNINTMRTIPLLASANPLKL